MMRSIGRLFAGSQRAVLPRFVGAARALSQERILITGAIGQIGLELLGALSAKYGENNVIATDVRKAPKEFGHGPYKYVDVLDSAGLSRLVVEENISTIIHLAAILSATGEANPHLALKINNEGTQNVFEVCRLHRLKLFVPSTIAVFGPSSPMENTPDDCILRPISMYGITKIHTELLAEYYYAKFGVDVRSLRYPGVISAHSMPGGGTTDYAVDIFHKAVTQNSFNCFLSENTMLPMMYMPDLLKATMDLMEAPTEKLTRRVYNLSAFSITPKMLAREIKKIIPNFSMTYNPDFRQKIADSWPNSIDDSLARRDWGWKPSYNVEAMTVEMLSILKDKYSKKNEE